MFGYKINLRLKPRYPASEDVYTVFEYGFFSKKQKATLFDISESGGFLLVSNSFLFSKKQSIRLKMLTQCGTRFNLVCRVVRVTPEGIGLRFDKAISAEMVGRLALKELALAA